MKLLDMVVSAHEALTAAMHEAAREVLAQAQLKKKESGAMMLDGGDRFERYLRRAWTQAGDDPVRQRGVARMLEDSVKYEVVSETTAEKLSRELGIRRG